jgi:DNA-binding FadR family transcriptional regulator
MRANVIETEHSNHRTPPPGPRVGPVLDSLLNHIRTEGLGIGDRLPSIRELSRQCNTSFGSARLAVERLEQMGVVERFRGSGTYLKEFRQTSFAAAPRGRRAPPAPSRP